MRVRSGKYGSAARVRGGEVPRAVRVRTGNYGAVPCALVNTVAACVMRTCNYGNRVIVRAHLEVR